MSIQSQTTRDVVRIERLSISQSSTGGQIRAYDTANRGKRPTEVPCRIQPLRTRERLQFGVRSDQAAWKILCSVNPQISVEDRLIFTDVDGKLHTARVLEPSRNLDMQSRLYRAIVEEIGNTQ